MWYTLDFRNKKLEHNSFKLQTGNFLHVITKTCANHYILHQQHKQALWSQFHFHTLFLWCVHEFECQIQNENCRFSIISYPKILFNQFLILESEILGITQFSPCHHPATFDVFVNFSHWIIWLACPSARPSIS